MEIDIVEVNRIRYRNAIYINRIETYISFKDSDFELADIRLLDSEGNCRLVITNHSSLFKTNYSIERESGEILNYKTKSFWRGHFTCESEIDNYDIYKHYGYKCSVYKNGKQIAWWDNNVSFSCEKNTIKIIADNETNYELIIAFSLICFDKLGRRTGSNALSIDLGNIGPQAKKFDKHWQPT